MAEKVFARQLEGGLWQWRQVADNGSWASEYYSTGDAEAVANSRHASSIPVLVALSGQHVVCSDVDMESIDKRHLAKLLPFEMEDNLVESVDDLHFTFAAPTDEKVNVLYVRNRVMEGALEQLQEEGCDIPTCMPDYFFLARENDGATIVHEDDVVFVHYESGKGFTIEANLAPLIVSGIDRFLNETNTVNLVADSEEKLEAMVTWLPEKWRRQDAEEEPEEGFGNPEVKASIGGFWDWVDPTIAAGSLNLRRGRFARQLPFVRWFQAWKVTSIVVLVAFFLSVGVTYGQYLSAKKENKYLVEQIQKVYQQAVPGGRSRDPERDLETKVSSIQKKSEPSNFIPLFNAVAIAVSKGKDISISDMRYNADQRELQVNLSGKDFTTLENMRGAVEASGFAAEFLRVDKQSDSHKARMKVSEAK